MEQFDCDDETAPLKPSVGGEDNLSSGESNSDLNSDTVKLILVRDIGVQVCGDSPNLNLNRRMAAVAAAQGATGTAPVLVNPRPYVSVGALPSAVESAQVTAPSPAVTSSKSVQDVKNTESDFQDSENFAAEVLF